MTEGTTDTTGTGTATAVQPTPPLVNADGELREGWRDSLPEDIRADKVFDRVSNWEGMAKTLASAEKMIGRNKVAVPNEASDEAEWDAFYLAGGRPDTAADYGFTRPEELAEEYYSEERSKKYMELFHKIGLSKKQAQAIFDTHNADIVAHLALNKQNAELEMETLKNGLALDWGNAYEQKKHLGNVAVEQGVNGDEEFKVRLTNKFGNDPDFIRFAANVGSRFVEHGAVDTSKLIPTPGDIQAQIDEEVAKPVYGADYAKHGFTKAQHQAQVAKVSALFQQKVKSTKTG